MQTRDFERSCGDWQLISSDVLQCIVAAGSNLVVTT